MATKKKPTTAKNGKPKQDPPDDDAPRLMFKRVMVTKTLPAPAGPTVSPKSRRNVTKAQAKPKTRAKSTGANKANRYDPEQWSPRPKPYFDEATSARVAIPSRGYNYTDASYTGKTPYERAREVDQATMSGQAAGQRRRVREVMPPDELPVYPRPEAPVQWAAVPKKTRIRKKTA